MDKQTTIFAGHYGSGKTTLAINWALALRQHGYDVAFCDLDVINPYFNSAAAAGLLTRHGIALAAPPLAGTGIEAHTVPNNVYAALTDTSVLRVVDVGGDDRGMTVLGSLSSCLTPGGFDLWLTVNFRRPMSRTPELALELLRDMESASGLRFTGIVNNTNVGAETTEADLLKGASDAQRLSELTGLPVVLNTARRGLMPEYFQVDMIEMKYKFQ